MLPGLHTMSVIVVEMPCTLCVSSTRGHARRRSRVGSKAYGRLLDSLGAGQGGGCAPGHARRRRRAAGRDHTRGQGWHRRAVWLASRLHRSRCRVQCEWIVAFHRAASIYGTEAAAIPGDGPIRLCAHRTVATQCFIGPNRNTCNACGSAAVAAQSERSTSSSRGVGQSRRGLPGSGFASLGLQRHRIQTRTESAGEVRLARGDPRENIKLAHNAADHPVPLRSDRRRGRRVDRGDCRQSGSGGIVLGNPRAMRVEGPAGGLDRVAYQARSRCIAIKRPCRRLNRYWPRLLAKKPNQNWQSQ